MKIKLDNILIVLLVLTIVSCNNSDQFGFMDDVTEGIEIEAVEIVSYSPMDSNIRVMDSTDNTFVVAVNPGAGNEVVYEFFLDDVSLQSGSESFYQLLGSTVDDGSHILKVVASNGLGSDMQLFNLAKNYLPVITPNNPPALGNNLACNSGSINFDVSAIDADGDDLTFSWRVDDVEMPAMFTVTTVNNVSSANFSPSCILNGLKEVSVVVDDGHETVTNSWMVTVSNPTVANINSYTPLDTTVVIVSTGSQLFSVSAEGKDPLSYEWLLDDTTIPAATESFYTLTAGSLSVGVHTLKIVVSDNDSNDEYIFQIVRNAPPSIDIYSPNKDSMKYNVESLVTASVMASDSNGDSLTYTWTVDGGAHPNFIGAPIAGGSQAIGNPDDSVLGDHMIEVSVSDGHESVSRSWAVNINYFSDVCNNLEAGEICTVVGYPGIGNGNDPSQNEINIVPSSVEDDGNGNLFITDNIGHVIWFYNRSGSVITVLGKDVAAGKMEIVVGSGMRGSTTAGTSHNDIKLNYPETTAWDSVTGSLFIAVRAQSRVVMVNSSGVASFPICNGSSTNNSSAHPVDGLATAHACYNSYGVAIDVARRYLYVSSLSHHYIKRFDISNADPALWTGRLIVGEQNSAGTVSAGDDEGTINSGPGNTGDARLYGPYAMDVDSEGNLYVAEYTRHRIRFINLSGGSKSFFGGDYVVAANNTRKLFGVNGGAGYTVGAYNIVRVDNPRGVAVLESGGVVTGVFATNTDRHNVVFVNNTAAPITIGDREVPAYEGQRVFGTTTAEYNGDSGAGMSSYLYSPYGISLSPDNSTLYVADRSNYRVRSLDISVDDGDITTHAGAYSKYYFNGDSERRANSVRLNGPREMFYYDSDNTLLYSDTNNGRIRGVDLSTGEVTTWVGKGRTNNDGNDEDPLDMYLYEVRDLYMYNDNLYFVDRHNSDTINRNCLIKAYNRDSSVLNIFNISIGVDTVSSIAGNYVLGCGNFDNEGGDAISTRLGRPEGVMIHDGEMIFSNAGEHCFLKIDAAGVISKFFGLCNTVGDVNGIIGSGNVRMRYPGDIEIDPLHSVDGNFFFVDQTDRTVSKIKYVNRSTGDIIIGGITASAGAVTTIFSSGGYSNGVAAFGNQICYSSGYESGSHISDHNVVCKDRSTDFGTTTMRIGSPEGSADKGGAQLGNEQEGINASAAKLAAPYGIAFDAVGNLYITERYGHVIRMVKKWW